MFDQNEISDIKSVIDTIHKIDPVKKGEYFNTHYPEIVSFVQSVLSAQKNVDDADVLSNKELVIFCMCMKYHNREFLKQCLSNKCKWRDRIVDIMGAVMDYGVKPYKFFKE